MDWSSYNGFRREFLEENSFWKMPILAKSSFQAAAEIAAGKKVLDIGASDRRFGKFCENGGIPLKGYETVDIDKKVKPDYDSIDKVKGKFGIITMFAAIEHMQPELARGLVKKCASISDEMAISTNNIYFPAWGFFDDITHVKPYSPRTVYAMLREAGFNSIKIFRVYKPGRIPIFIKEIQSRINNQDFCPEILAVASK